MTSPVIAIMDRAASRLRYDGHSVTADWLDEVQLEWTVVTAMMLGLEWMRGEG